MLRLLLASSAVAAISSSSASAVLPYRFGVFDFGVIPGSLASPITWTGPGDNRAFTSNAGSVLAPPADAIDANPRLRYDDYFMIDPLGQSVGGDPGVSGDGYSATPLGFLISGSGFGPGQAFGVASAGPGPDGLGGIDAGPDGRVFLMNLTLRQGSSAPTTPGAIIQILREGNVPGANYVFSALRFGIENATNQASENVGTLPVLYTQRYYYLDYIATPVPASELPASFGASVNYQIFLAQTDVPAPGAALALLGAGSMAARRRR
jgi:hypothetical protein